MSGTYEDFREQRVSFSIPTAKIAELAKCSRFAIWEYETGKSDKLAIQLWKALRSLQPKEEKEEIRPQNLLTITKVYESVFEHDGYNLRAWWEPVYGGGWDVAVHVMGVTGWCAHLLCHVKPSMEYDDMTIVGDEVAASYKKVMEKAAKLFQSDDCKMIEVRGYECCTKGNCTNCKKWRKDSREQIELERKRIVRRRKELAD